MSFGFGRPTAGCVRRLSRPLLPRARFSFLSIACVLPVVSVVAWSGACANGDNGVAVTTDASFASDAPASDAAVDGSDGATAADAPSMTIDAAPDVTDAQEAGDDAQTASDAVADGGAGDAAEAGCAGTKILCGSTCIDPTSDPLNCGSCGAVCPSNTCGTAISLAVPLPDGGTPAAPPNWNFNGVALWDSDAGSARMTTANTENVSGTVVYDDAIVTDSFQASFQFRIGANGGGRFDGMGFMLETDGPTALGSNGGGLGMEGLDGIGVEFDVYNNGKCGDSTDDHVGIDMLSNCASGQPTSLLAEDVTSSVELYNTGWHTATVQLSGSSISLGIDGNPAISNLQLSETSGFLTGTRYYFGFAGGIGGGNGSLGAQTEVKNVTVTFPTPRCL